MKGFFVPQGKKLYIFSAVTTEGFESAEGLYFADNNLDVVTEILAQVQRYIKRGKDQNGTNYRALTRLEWPNIFPMEDVERMYSLQDLEYSREKTRLFDEFLLNTTPNELLQIMDESRAGEDFAQVSIIEVNPSNIVNLSKGKNPHLFILSETFDEGFYGPEDVFWGNNVLDVVKYIREQIEEARSESSPYYLLYKSIIGAGAPEDINDISDAELLAFIDESRVDGDSYAKVAISEYDPKEIPVL